jgi:hypothetical protein
MHITWGEGVSQIHWQHCMTFDFAAEIKTNRPRYCAYAHQYGIGFMHGRDVCVFLGHACKPEGPSTVIIQEGPNTAIIAGKRGYLGTCDAIPM